MRRLTQPQPAACWRKVLGQPQKLAVTSSFDQRPIDAWMITPPDFDPARKYPLILEIHGGPFAAYGPTFSTDDQLYAAAGYVVLYTNPRGSTSYGEAFANQIDKNYPGHDYDDLMSAVDAAIATGHRRSQQSVRHRRLGRRRADRLDRRQDRPLPRRGDPEAGDQLDQLRADHRRRRRSTRPTGSARNAVGGPAGLLDALAAEPGRQRQDADPGRRRQRGLSHARSARPSNIIPRSSCAACRRRWSRSRARATAASPRGRARRRPRRAAILAWFDRYRTKQWVPAANAGFPELPKARRALTIALLFWGE